MTDRRVASTATSVLVGPRGSGSVGEVTFSTDGGVDPNGNYQSWRWISGLDQLRVVAIRACRWPVSIDRDTNVYFVYLEGGQLTIPMGRASLRQQVIPPVVLPPKSMLSVYGNESWVPGPGSMSFSYLTASVHLSVTVEFG